jgi:hypothetical protein
MSEREPSVHRAHQAMGPGHEFDTIRMLMARWGNLAVDIGDDAAVLAPAGNRTRVISTDACVEDAHFRRCCWRLSCPTTGARCWATWRTASLMWCAPAEHVLSEAT